MKTLRPFLFCFGCLAACGGSDEESIDVEGCEHLQEGPAVAVTATATTSGAPAVSNDHMRYDVALVSISGGLGGFVGFASSEATDYVIFLDADVSLAVQDSSQQAVALEASAAGSPACTDIRGKHTVALGVGTYFLGLGPTPAPLVSVVLEEREHTH